jgi:hypothetical protein
MRIEDDANINYPITSLGSEKEQAWQEGLRTINNYIANKEANMINSKQVETSTGLVRPCADYQEYYGEDGRDDLSYIISYRCPQCGKPIRENDIGCIDCKIFFDWSKKAKVKTVTTLVWE